MNLKQILCGSIAMALLFTSCKKDKDKDNDPNNPPEDCKVIKYRCESRNETWRIVYNSSGSIDSILISDQQNVDEIRKFNYSNKAIDVKKFFQGTLYQTSHVELNALGNILSIRDISPVSDNWEQESFIYRSDIPALVDKSILTVKAGGSSFDSHYEWEVIAGTVGFSMTNFVTGSGTYEYGYYFNKPTQAGDYLNFEKITACYDRYYRPFSSPFLLKSVKEGNDVLADVTYAFDNTGRITSFTVDYDGASSAEKWDLTYDCQ